MALIFCGRIVQILLTLAMMKTATTLLGPAEFGRLALVTSLVALFALSSVNPVVMYVNRRFHEWDANGGGGRHMRSFWFYLVLVAFFAVAGLLIAIATDALHIDFPGPMLAFLVAGLLIATSANQTLVHLLNMREDRGWYIALTVITLGLNLGFSAFAALSLGASAEVWAAGTLIANIGIALLAHARLNARAPNESRAPLMPARESRAKIFAFGWPIAIAVTLTWIQTQGYRFLIEDQMGVDALGLFVAGYGLSAGILVAVESVMTGYFQPRFFKRISVGDRDEQGAAWNDYLATLLPTAIVTAGFIVGFSGPLTRILLGPQFSGAAAFASIAAFAETARVLASAYGLVAHARVRTSLLLGPHVAGAVVAIVGVWTLTRAWGLEGTGWGLVAASAALCLSMHVVMKKQAPLRLPVKASALAMLAAGLFAAFGYALPQPEGLMPTVGVVFACGLIYLAAQYLLLRPWLRASR